MIAFGDPNAPVILFLHGATANKHMWLPNLAPLSDEFRTVAINQPGHGDRREQPFTLDGAADETVAWLEDNAPEGATLVGLSGGGYVGMLAAAVRPDLVRGLVLSGATASYAGWGGLQTKLYGYLFPLLAKRLEPKSIESWKKLAPDELADAMLAEGISMRAGGAAFRQIPGRDYRAMLARYPGPVMILNGERDTVNRKEEPDLLLARPDAEIVMIPDAGHACSVTRADVFNQHVRRFASRATRPGSAAADR